MVPGIIARIINKLSTWPPKLKQKLAEIKSRIIDLVPNIIERDSDMFTEITGIIITHHGFIFTLLIFNVKRLHAADMLDSFDYKLLT